jgi:hypothetical protein
VNPFLRQRVLHILQLEVPYDGFHLFHEQSTFAERSVRRLSIHPHPGMLTSIGWTGDWGISTSSRLLSLSV